MDVTDLRRVAAEVIAALETILADDPTAASRVHAELDTALCLPDEEAEIALWAALSLDHRVFAWAQRQLMPATRAIADDERIIFEPEPAAIGGVENLRAGDEIRGETDVPAVGSIAAAAPPPRQLWTRMQDKVETRRRLSLLVAITLAPQAGSAALKDFVVPPQGLTVTIVVASPGLKPEGDMEQDVLVPAGADSEHRRFAFTAGPIGLHPVTVDVFNGGTHLGGVRLEVSVEASADVSDQKVRVAELSSVASEPGEVTLQVVREGDDYRFQLFGDALYKGITQQMGDVKVAVSALVAELTKMAANQSDYKTSALVRETLKYRGMELWAAAVPKALQDQFWEQADRIKMFSIAADQDVIPWELLYPANGSNDNGFLAEQFPVVRRAYAERRVRSIPIDSAAFVIPPASPTDAMAEVTQIRQLLGPRIGDRGTLSGLSAVRALMLDTQSLPGIIHFACHNSFSDAAGSSIGLDGGPWKPGDLAEAMLKSTLSTRRPLVFLNACRSAGEIALFSQMSGWAGRFVQAGAGAFIGSLWAVRSSTAKTFAETFYDQFVGKGMPLGTSSLMARRAVAQDGGDPTWLAYSVYGNPATVVANEEE